MPAVMTLSATMLVSRMKVTSATPSVPPPSQTILSARYGSVLTTAAYPARIRSARALSMRMLMRAASGVSW